MWFGLLGPLRVQCDDAEVLVSAPRQRVLLAALLVRAGQVVSRDELAESVWDGAPPGGEDVTLRSYMTRLRRVLGPAGSRIRTCRPGYLIEADDSEVDLLRFGTLCVAGAAAARSGAWEQASGTLASALVLWRGTPLGDVPSEMLQRAEVPRLDRMRLQALEDRIHADLQLGRHLEVIAEVELLAGAHPLRERLHALLMEALYRAGRQADALDAYGRARRHLVEELGVEPGPELRELHRQILAGHPVGGAVAREATTRGPEGVVLSSPIVVPRQLPAVKPWFVGRADELTFLRCALEQSAAGPGTPPIVAITGPAGVGKTALALHAAGLAADRFPDGHLYVDLRGNNPGRAPVATDEAIRGFLYALQAPTDRLPSPGPALEGLYRSLLVGKRILIVLEDARDSQQVRPLLPGNPGCVVLVTSRAQLTGLAVEGAYPIGLDVLKFGEARQLLTRALGAERAAAEPGPLNEMIALCARLPLALTIAAARAAARPAFSIAALSAELRDARNRLDALDTGEPGVSVRAAFDWSYENLSPAAARMFRLLGVHPGPDISLPAAASLAGTSPRQARKALGELTQAHLAAEHVPGRYAFHDLLRTYAAEQAAAGVYAAEHQAAIRRVLDHYTHSAHWAVSKIDPTHLIPLPQPAPGTAPERMTGVEEALGWLGTEHQVLLAAVAAAADNDLHVYAWRLPTVLRGYFARGGHWHDWVAVQRIALAAASRLGDEELQARAHRGLGDALGRIGAGQEAQAHLQQATTACRRLGDQAEVGECLLSFAVHFSQLGEIEQALRHASEALDLFQNLADSRIEHATALNAVGWYHACLGRSAQTQFFCERALSMFQDLGDRFGEAITLDSLGYSWLQVGDQVRAVSFYQRALVAYRDVGDRFFQALTLDHLADAYREAGNPDAARAARQRSVVILQELGKSLPMCWPSSGTYGTAAEAG